jgi:Fe-S-cluster containining protein
MSVAISACLSCEGRCCAAYIVPLTGRDVWQIVQGQRLDPELFVQREPEDYPTSTGFFLRPNGPTFGIALRHQYDRRNERPCIFLMHLRDGVRRCGIYAHRPRACQTYPMRRHAAGVELRNDMLCPGGSWAGIYQQPGEWHELLVTQDEEWEIYTGVVQAWNRAVGQRPADNGYVLDQYLGYLVAAYDELNRYDNQHPDQNTWDTALTALAEAWTR